MNCEKELVSNPTTEAELEGKDATKWEHLPADVVAFVFKKLNLWYLMFVVPLVCRSWRSASMDPSCWTVLDVRSYMYCDYDYVFGLCDPRTFRVQTKKLVMAAVNRAGQNIRHMVFPNDMFVSSDNMIYISERSRSLKRIVIQGIEIRPIIFQNWSELEAVCLYTPDWGCRCDSVCKRDWYGSKSKSVIQMIGLHCKQLKEFKYCGVLCLCDALVIGTSFPNLRVLDLSMSTISEEVLLAVLDHCVDLKSLNISHGRAFENAKAIDWDIFQRATSLHQDPPKCISQVNTNTCEICEYIGRTDSDRPLNAIWMLEEVCFPWDTKLLTFGEVCFPWDTKLPTFGDYAPQYIAAVLTDQEERFQQCFDSWQSRREEARERNMLNAFDTKWDLRYLGEIRKLKDFKWLL